MEKSWNCVFEFLCVKCYDWLECVVENYFLYFSSKTYVVGTQKNRLNETVLLSTQNTCLNWWVRKNYNNFMLIKFPYLDLCKCYDCWVFLGGGRGGCRWGGGGWRGTPPRWVLKIETLNLLPLLQQCAPAVKLYFRVIELLLWTKIWQKSSHVISTLRR